MPKRSKAAQSYYESHRSCEACGFPAQEIHHILTRRMGADEPWNFLSLCLPCHEQFHNHGRRTFAERHPDLAPKIKAACERLGRTF